MATKPCPFKAVDITSPGFEGCINLIHTETQYPIAMVRKEFAPEIKELIAAWKRGYIVEP